MDHDKLVDYVQEYFVNNKAIWVNEKSTLEGPKLVDTSLAQYTGGLVKVG